MKRAAAVLASILTFALLGASPAFAAMRCGTKLVTEGDTRSEVALKCGEPTEVLPHKSVLRRPVIWRHGRPFFIGDDFIEIEVESWIYNLGPNKLMRRLRFEDGVLAEIETLGYGYGGAG
jgi:hypothetical protein